MKRHPAGQPSVASQERTDGTFSRGFVGFRSSVATEGPETATVHDVRVTAENGDTLLDTDFAADGNPFSAGALTPGGLEIAGNVEALYRSADDNLPLLRTDFDTAEGKTLTSARVYATARGIYELAMAFLDDPVATGDVGVFDRVGGRLGDGEGDVAEALGGSAVGGGELDAECRERGPGGAGLGLTAGRQLPGGVRRT